MLPKWQINAESDKFLELVSGDYVGDYGEAFERTLKVNKIHLDVYDDIQEWDVQDDDLEYMVLVTGDCSDNDCEYDEPHTHFLVIDKINKVVQHEVR